MPRIRKETSNRRSTNDRAKLHKKIKEGKKKKRKEAKKNPQWKSKKAKDPGIPNEFPYKDQILAEVAEQRRMAAEEKQLKKEEKQRALAKARAIARGEDVEDFDVEVENNSQAGDDQEAEEQPSGKKDLNVGAESIASLSVKLINARLKPRPKPEPEIEEEEEEEEEVPVLINRDLPNLKTVLEKADVVLEVLDARDPLSFRSQRVEEAAKEMGKKVLFVLNKIDSCPREAVASWSEHLRGQRPTLIFRSATSFLPETPLAQPQAQVKKGKGKAKVPADDAVGTKSLLACLAHLAKEKKNSEPLTVAVVGVTNVGKSSLINSLLKHAALPVYTLVSSSRGPTTTELPQEVTLEAEEQKITFIDTPGLSFASDEDVDGSILEERRARDILLRRKGRIDRLKDPNPSITHIVSRANAEDLMLLYSLPAFAKGDPTAFLSGVARANQLVKRKGEPDLTGAARIVLRDWNTGKFAHYTTPPPQPASSSNAAVVPAESSAKSDSKDEDSTFTSFVAQLYATADEAILAGLPTRKERRKQGGLVRFTSGTVDERQVDIEGDWPALEGEESDDDDEGEVGFEGMDVDEEEAEGEEEEGEEEGEGEDGQDEEEGGEEVDSAEEDADEEKELTPPPLKSNKQKRKRAVEASVVERPSKKVTFSAPTSKHSRPGPKMAADNKRTPLKPALQKPVKSALAPPKKSQDKAVSTPTPAPKVEPKTKKSGSTKISAGSAAAKSSSAEKKGKVANVSAKKAKGPDGGVSSGPEVYDFGKFFH